MLHEAWASSRTWKRLGWREFITVRVYSCDIEKDVGSDEGVLFQARNDGIGWDSLPHVIYVSLADLAMVDRIVRRGVFPGSGDIALRRKGTSSHVDIEKDLHLQVFNGIHYVCKRLNLPSFVQGHLRPFHTFKRIQSSTNSTKTRAYPYDKCGHKLTKSTEAR